MKVYVRHARAILGPNQKGYCVPGMRTFFKRHGLDFEDFVRNGIEAQVLLDTNDIMAEAAVNVARQETLDGER